MLIFLYEKKLKKLENKIDDLIRKLEVKEINKFVELMQSTHKMFWRAFILGIGRGLGTAIGFSILGAIIICLLKELVTLNIPKIGTLISDIIRATENSL